MNSYPAEVAELRLDANQARLQLAKEVRDKGENVSLLKALSRKGLQTRMDHSCRNQAAPMISCVKMWETWTWVVVSIRLQEGL